MMDIKKIKKVNVPAKSLTQPYLPANYIDAFSCNVFGARKLTADELQIDFWTVMPKWVNALFKLRNFIVAPFGLKTGKEDGRIEDFKNVILNGGSIGLTSVVGKSEDETVLLLSDKHLNAYMSVMVIQNKNHQTITVITLVHYHNTLGKTYFFFIKPFHKIIVKVTLKSTLNRILK